MLTDREQEILAAHLARQKPVEKPTIVKVTKPPIEKEKRDYITPREREVLTWIAKGKDREEIAALVGISPRTVARHLASASEVLGTSNRISTCVQAGILKLVD